MVEPSGSRKVVVLCAVTVIAANIQLEKFQFVFPDVVEYRVAQDTKIRFGGDAELSRNPAVGDIAVPVGHSGVLRFLHICRPGNEAWPHGGILTA